jgi:cytochrome c biogenesis protein CcdA
MVAYLIYAMAAFYLGVLTSISPCPLATNIAAISYIGRKVENPRLVLAAGLLYTLGRCLLYLGLAALLASTAMSIPTVSLFLQKYIHLVLGPIFLLLGMFLVGLITINSGGTFVSDRMQKRIDAMGIWGALLLGILFAVSFCPTSAAWFFGLLTLIMGSKAEAITSVLAQVGISQAEVEEMYHVMAIANYEDRFVIPSTHREYAENTFNVRGGCGFSFGNGCSEGTGETSLFGSEKRRTIPIKAEV